VILTASGGPFLGKKPNFLINVKKDHALQHPNWSMGAKITIDSASLMNKGLEMIEAKWLFGLKNEQIEVIIHPQSIIHSMVRFNDGSTLAQLGLPDMRLPIQYTLVYPERVQTNLPRMEIKDYANLTFEAPDEEKFPALGLARRAVGKGGTLPAVMNAANEEAVALFLNRKIAYLDITRRIERVMESHTPVEATYENVLHADEWAREQTKNH